MDKSFILEFSKSALTVGGIVVAWLLSVRTININRRKEEEKKLRRLLYYLLELRFRVIRECTMEEKLSRAMSFFRQLLKAKYNVAANDKQVGVVQNMLMELVREHLKFDEIYKDLTAQANNALIELAEWEPLFAHELTGRHDIMAKSSFLKDVFASAENEKKDDPPPTIIKEAVKKTVDKQFIKDLEESLRRIARRIGRKTSRELKYTLFEKGIHQEEDNELDKQIEELIEDLVKDMADMYKK